VRVLMVAPYPPQQDGIGVHTRYLVDALAAHATVSVLTRQVPAPDEPGIYRALSASPRSLVRARRLLGELRPEVVHYQFNIPALGVAWLWAFLAGLDARRRGTKVVLTLHEVRRDLAMLGGAGGLLYRGLARLADGLIVYTEEARELLVGRCGLDADRITVLPHGAPVSLGAADGGAPARPFGALGARYGLTAPPLLFVGYLHPDKGVEHLLGAVAVLARRRPSLLEDRQVLIAGGVRARSGLFRLFEGKDRRYEAALHEVVAAHGLGSIVRFVGHVPDEDLPGLLHAAYAAVLPYNDATQSGVLNLLVAAHVPVVASRLPGLADTLGDAGLLFSPGEDDELAEALERLLADPHLRDELAARMAKVHQKVSFSAVGAQLGACYERIVAGGFGPAPTSRR